MSDAKQKIEVPVGIAYLEDTCYSGQKVFYCNTESVDPERSLEAIAKRIAELQKKYGSQYENLRLESIRDCGCRYDCNCSPTYRLKGIRLENDMEQKVRIDKTTRDAAAQKERDERALADLAKRLGKTVV